MPTSSPACVGCLGTRECWVCLGRGDYGPTLRATRCRRCLGTGRCDLCAAPGELESYAADTDVDVRARV